MRGTHALTRTVWLIALGLAACAPASDNDGLGYGDNAGNSVEHQQAAPFIDIAPNSPISLAMRGGIGPIVEGQTVNAAYLRLDSIQLVGVNGTVVPLIDQPMTLDLLSIQNGLEGLASQLALQPGRFSHMRCQLGGMFIEVASDQGGVQFFATPGLDYGQFGPTGPVGPLALESVQPGGFFDVAIPPDGIMVEGATSLAMQVDLAASLTYESGAWAFSPRAWVVDESVFSSLDVRFEAEAAGFSQFVEQGAEVMLFDAGMRPVSYAPLAMLPGGVPGATFQYLAPFQGPFVAVLVPPPGIQLTNVVSVSVNVSASVHAQTSIVINSFQQVSSVSGVSAYQVGFAEQASFVQYGSAGAIVGRSMVPVGPIQAIAPHVRPRVPIAVGQAPLPPVNRIPYLRGLPAPSWARGQRGVLPGGPPRFHERHHRPGMPGVFPGERPGGPGQHRPGERPGRPGIFPGERPGGPGQHRPGERPGRPGIFPGERPGGPGQHRPGERPGRPGIFPGERPGGPGQHRPGERPGRPGVSPGERPGRPGVSPGERPGGPGARPIERPGSPGTQRPGTGAGRPGFQRPSSGSGQPSFPGIQAPESRPGRSRSNVPRGGAPPLSKPSSSRSGPDEPGVIMRPSDRTQYEPTQAEDHIPIPQRRGLTQPQGPQRGQEPPARRPAAQGSELQPDSPGSADAPSESED